MPQSRAAWTTRAVASASSLEPKLLQPSPTTETCRPLLPSRRKRMDILLSGGISSLYGEALSGSGGRADLLHGYTSQISEREGDQPRILGVPKERERRCLTALPGIRG